MVTKLEEHKNCQISKILCSEGNKTSGCGEGDFLRVSLKKT
jgi:hypothetical protein